MSNKSKNKSQELKIVIAMALWLGVQQGAHAQSDIADANIDIAGANSLENHDDDDFGAEGAPTREFNAAEALQNHNSNITTTEVPEPIEMFSTNPEMSDSTEALSEAQSIDNNILKTREELRNEAEREGRDTEPLIKEMATLEGEYNSLDFPSREDSTENKRKEVARQAKIEQEITESNERTWAEWLFGAKPTPTESKDRTWAEWLFGTKPTSKSSGQENSSKPQEPKAKFHQQAPQDTQGNYVGVNSDNGVGVKQEKGIPKVKHNPKPTNNLLSKNTLKKKVYNKKYPERIAEEEVESTEKMSTTTEASTKALQGN